MITIESLRPGLLLLPRAKLTLKPKTQVSLPALTEEIERAVKAGWVRIVEPIETPAGDANVTHPITHDWRIDYTQVEAGKVTITDRAAGKSLSAEIAERKGDQHFTLKTFGTVKGQQYWPTAPALERFDATD